MRRTLLFRFEELPLLIEAGFEAGAVDGQAEIAYHGDGEWSVAAIALDGARRLTHTPQDLHAAAACGRILPRFAVKAIALDEGEALFLRIHHRLEHEWRAKVMAAVIEQIAADRDAAPDCRADQRRARRAI
jgi:hypothetical protein